MSRRQERAKAARNGRNEISFFFLFRAFLRHKFFSTSRRFYTYEDSTTFCGLTKNFFSRKDLVSLCSRVREPWYVDVASAVLTNSYARCAYNEINYCSCPSCFISTARYGINRARTNHERGAAWTKNVCNIFRIHKNAGFNITSCMTFKIAFAQQQVIL